MDKKPFTKEEHEIMGLLIEAHNKFIALERKHPMEVQEWVTPFHHLQNILIARVAARDYPDYFTQSPLKPTKPKEDPLPNGTERLRRGY